MGSEKFSSRESMVFEFLGTEGLSLRSVEKAFSNFMHEKSGLFENEDCRLYYRDHDVSGRYGENKIITIVEPKLHVSNMEEVITRDNVEIKKIMRTHIMKLLEDRIMKVARSINSSTTLPLDCKFTTPSRGAKGQEGARLARAREYRCDKLFLEILNNPDINSVEEAIRYTGMEDFKVMEVLIRLNSLGLITIEAEYNPLRKAA